MRKLAPLSGTLAALMIASALSGCGGGKVEPSNVPASVATVVPAAAKAAAAATAAKAKAAAAAKVKSVAAAKARTAAAAKARTAARAKTAARARAQAAADVQAAADAAAAADSIVFYENCTAVRDAGADPIRRGDPGYSSDLDRDGDGIACE